jgi:predicted dehydrogenase
MERIKVGIIGYGYWGPNLTRNFYEIPEAELIAVADLSDDRLKIAQSRFPHLTVTKNYQDLFTLGVQAVIIATPPATHFQIAMDCMEHNLHVLVEKPITLKSADAEELIKMASKKELTLMVGHIFEYNSAVRVIKSYIDSGYLGQIYYLDTARLNLGLFQRNANVLWDLAPHDISVLLYLLGKRPISVSAQGLPCVSKGIHDVAYVNLVFPDNISAHIHVSWLDPCKVRRITVVGSKKMVVFNDIENETKIKIYDKGVDVALEDLSGFGEYHWNYRSGDITIPNIRYAEPLRQECLHFLECIVNHTEPTSSGRDGMEVVKILETATHSLENGQSKEVIKW